MSEDSVTPVPSLDRRLDAFRAAAFILEWPLPRERDEAVCDEFAHWVDALLACVARGFGALEVAIGEALDALGMGDRALQLGYASIGDYARERLGIAASTAVKMARFAKALRDRPILRAAVRTGEVNARAAEAVLPVAVGDAEAAWVARARARTATVRALRVAVKEGTAPEPEEDKWDRVGISVPLQGLPAMEEATALARKVLGATAPKWELLVAMAEEYLGAHQPPEGTAEPLSSGPAQDLLEPLKEWLEQQTAQWASLVHVEPVPAPATDARHDPRSLDSELRRLSSQRDHWDEVVGHLAMVFQACEGWRRVGFASFEHYCTERLRMGERTVAQRAALERRLYQLPLLREAMRKGRLSYEKARLLARHVDEDSIPEWIERAERMTCIGLRRALEGKEQAQMSARGGFVAVVPRRVRTLLALAFQAARKDAGRFLSPGECLWRMAEHFIDVWKPALQEGSTLPKQVLARDRGLCQVPGCSRAATQAHHVDFRSHGGADDPANLIALCAAHHLHCVHMGWIRVRGRAPDGLRWELGVRAGFAPLIDFLPQGLDAAFAGAPEG